MIDESEIDILESNIGKLDALHTEMSVLAKKSPNDGVNLFKLRFVNSILAACNEQLKDKFRPFADFEQFDESALPTTSDVTFIAAQYMEAMERYRCEQIVHRHGIWYYDNGTDKPSRRTYSPRKIASK